MADDEAGDQRAEVRTFLIADVRGYTRFTQTRGDEAAAELAARFAAIVQEVVEPRDGNLLELRGDEALVVFSSPRQAVRCALELQARFVEETLTDPRVPLGVGIGIDSGEAIPVRGGYRGAALNLAARLCSAAAAGQVLASSEVTHLARKIDGIKYVDRGRTHFKGIDEPTQVMRVVPEGRDPVADAAFALAVNPPDLSIVARRRQERQRRLMVTALAALVLLVDVVVVVDRTNQATSLDQIGSNAVGRVSLGGGNLHARVPVGQGPGPIAAGAGAVWVGNVIDSSVSRIDMVNPDSINTVPLDTEPSGIAVGGPGVWVTHAANRTVSLINPGSAKVVQSIDVGTAPQAIAFGFGQVWVANALEDSVSVIDASRVRVVRTIPVGAAPTGVAVGFGSVWVADSGSGVVSRIDPGSKTVTASVSVGNSPQSLVVDRTGVWVTNTLDDTVSRISPETNNVVGTVHVGSEPNGIAAGGGSIWVANANDDTVSRIDPGGEVGRVVKTVPLGNAPQAAVAAAGDLWLTARGSAAEHGAGTLRVIANDDDTQSMDPAIAFTVLGWNLLSVVNDGLVTFRRTAGPNGGQIVPDLAVRMPTVSDGGRTYTFQLRPGIRYSDGSLVRASDFRRSMERMLAISPGAYLYTLVGTETCRRHKCDLSEGIVTDDDTGTITVHLNEPDSDLLSELALPFASLLPPDLPADDIGFGPHPATGPYLIESGSHRHVHLVRNPRFRPWSSIAQPAGYPDAIDVTFRDPSDDDEDHNMLAVARGDYDWTPDFVPGSAVDRLLRTRPTQLHRYTAPVTNYFTLNTRQPPFDDVRVRRAVNFAVDRAAVVDALGGETRAAVTCQVLPPTLYGYRPYCPYTSGARDTGTWTGSELATARALIRDAHVEGARVRVFPGPDEPGSVDFVVRAMRRIGLDPVMVRIPPNKHGDPTQRYFEYIGKPENRVAAASSAWYADYPEPANMFRPLLRCDAITLDNPVNLNAALFCNDEIDDAMDRAARLQQRDPAAGAAAWARLDRRVVDLAPWVFLTSTRGYDVVSQRLGNYQHHPQYGMLIDQAWVR
jgi:YVTN family beta-propeller protein